MLAVQSRREDLLPILASDGCDEFVGERGSSRVDSRVRSASHVRFGLIEPSCNLFVQGSLIGCDEQRQQEKDGQLHGEVEKWAERVI